MVRNIVFVGVGGFVGSVARYLISVWAASPGKFPYATFFVNVGGCFLIGLFAGMAERFGWVEETRLLLMVGLCGGFTTFSAFTIENVRLLQDRDYMTFTLYTIGSVAVGIIATMLGLFAIKG
jgi:CrcB protein